MKKRFFMLLVLGICLGVLFMVVGQGRAQKVNGVQAKGMAAASRELNSSGNVKVDLDFAKIPLYFISNQGQVNAQARFYAKARRYTLWLTQEGLVFDGIKKQNIENRIHNTGEKKQESPLTNDQLQMTNDKSPMTKYDRDVSRLLFIGANKHPVMVPLDEEKLKVNYFIGNDRSKWHCDVPTSMAVVYKNLYKNIDLKVYGIEQQIEYDWIVKPGGNPADIRFEYQNIKGTRIDEKGDLIIDTEFGELIYKKLVAFQEIGEKKNRVEVGYKKIAENSYGFALGTYDKSRSLIIDPVVLVYSTYLGGTSSELGYGIAVDSSGFVYITGCTGSADFPTLNSFQTYQGSWDVFVAKLDPSQSGASTLLYSTFMGGEDFDISSGIAVDSSGNVYVTGCTDSYDFPTLNPYQASYNGGNHDAFVTKLDPSQVGAAVFIYSTYLGGGVEDEGHAIATDSNGCIYVTGYTNSTDFPCLNSYQASLKGSDDAFVAKLDPSQGGTASLLYSTYLGGGNGDYGYGIAVDSNGHAYITGYTHSSDFPTLNPFQATLRYYDAFIAKLDPSQDGAASLIYSTYLGGGSFDRGYVIAVDRSGCVYVTGGTWSTDFPTLNPYQGSHNGGYFDVFVTKLDPSHSGSAGLLYSTYLGGESEDWGENIALDSNGHVYVTGATLSTDFPTLNPYQIDPGDGSCDAFVTKLDPSQADSASLIYSTYLGGGSEDYGHCIAVDSNCRAYITGYTESTDFPTMNPYQAAIQGEGDAFFAMLSFKEITVTAPNGGENWKLGSSQNITWLDAGVFGLLKITLWKDGVQLGVIADNINPEADSYTWTAGNYVGGTAAPGAGYTIKIKEAGTAVADTSDAPFTLSACLTVTSPNGTENWELGSNHNIAWNAVGVSGLLKITLWKDGVQIGVIADNVAPAADSYSWIVGQHSGGMAAPGVGYTIKIKEAGTSLSDTSDATFTLSPGITITSPNGGEAWIVGSARNITWKSGGLTNLIKITLWKDGVLIGTIATNANPVSGSYAWTVGNYIGGTAAPGAGYRIKIKEINTSVADDSDAVFQLTQ